MTTDVKKLEAELANTQEVWELTLPGRVHVTVPNHLGRPRDLSARGKGSKLRLSALDRELVEEQIRENASNPFRNGMLVQVGGDRPTGDKRREALSDEDLQEYFLVTDEDDFADVVLGLGEVNLRRMQLMIKENEVKATVQQSQKIDEIIEERYAVGGDTPTYREMYRAGDLTGGGKQ